MAYQPLKDFLLRAPLLPVAALKDPAAHLGRSPLADAALTLASPTLAAHRATKAARQAIARYARRAAFRPTPHGLWAGVMMGHLGPTTRIASGRHPRPHLDLSWARACAVGLDLLEDPDVRARVRLRRCPSLFQDAISVHWLGEAEFSAELRSAERSPLLARVLEATASWTPWPIVSAAAHPATRPDADADADADELLLMLIHDGLLLSDLTPPLLGPPPLRWLVRRLADVPVGDDVRDALKQVADHLQSGALDDATAATAALPGHDPELAAVTAVLLHQPRRPPQLARAAVERAAALAPLLFGLQDALAFPASERLAQPAVGEALHGVVELFGTGALDVSGLATGAYGIALDGATAAIGASSDAATPPSALLTLLMDRLTAARAAGDAQIDLSSDELAMALGSVGLASPPTAELFLVPCRPPTKGAPAPGTDWLLGLHAPGGATWGRFAHALGDPLSQALHALADAESAAFPDESFADVAFAPSDGHAELCAHPPIRDTALAITDWPDAPTTVTPAQLSLCAEPGGAVPLALRDRGTRLPLVPAPLARVRSTTAPPGIYRLLTGWSLFRQHAPWALTWGPLGDVEQLPRVSVDGFVVSPASWRVPAALTQATLTPRAAAAEIKRWRKSASVPPWVLVGVEDQLLPVELADPAAAQELAGAARVWEIWPPLDRGVDDDGRRVEAVIALCQQPDDEERDQHAAAARATREMGDVPPPHATPAATGWTTFKLFGGEEHQDHLLATVIAPLMADASDAGEIDGWFFLRYVEGLGPRPHLRLRAHSSADDGRAGAFAARLGAALQAAQQTGAVTTVETAPYFAEQARLGDDEALRVAHRIFESDSLMACACLQAATDDGEVVVELARSFDALAAGCGLDRAARHDLALARRRTLAPVVPPELDAAFRTHARELRTSFADPGQSSPIDDHRRRVASACASLSAEARRHLLPTLLHLAANRMAGPHADLEAAATVFWQRTLEGLLKSPAQGTRAPSVSTD